MIWMLSETGRDNLAVRFGSRAIKFEEKNENKTAPSIRFECCTKIRRGERETKRDRIRSDFLGGRGWGEGAIITTEREGEETWKIIEKRSIEIQKRERDEKIKESRYLKELKEVQKKKEEKPGYLSNITQKRKRELERIGRFRIGCETRMCRYWLKEEDKLCRCAMKKWKQPSM